MKKKKIFIMRGRYHLVVGRVVAAGGVVIMVVAGPKGDYDHLGDYDLHYDPS